ncbi:hypothetical protein FDH86_gp062 [Arthrobacter phage Tank]|uniref:Uncharacterized protein n=2 Tax=Tankvirus tank TaxID=1982567 RepID=A0A0U4JER4_9CAUD|nr:hypothetical protein FDH86_gp062 [Arthrobacter phage Tank]ALY10597.1 hypothetical protein TANK_62 [Arthrobacter phage Tank]ALY10848.1 hypothetical protein WILDE_64 [Arthrobacter phage Wilde]
MSLGRRFFTELAKEYREAKPGTGDDSTAVAAWAHMVTITASALQRQHGGFNRVRFYEAAGMSQEAIDGARSYVA